MAMQCNVTLSLRTNWEPKLVQQLIERVMKHGGLFRACGPNDPLWPPHPWSAAEAKKHILDGYYEVHDEGTAVQLLLSGMGVFFSVLPHESRNEISKVRLFGSERLVWRHYQADMLFPDAARILRFLLTVCEGFVVEEAETYVGYGQ